MESREDKMIFASNLRHYMESRGISKQKICDDLGIKYTTFVDWYNGKTYPRIGRVELLSRYFNIKKSDLIENKAHNETPFGFIPKPKMRSVPILGEIACGIPIYADENYIGSASVPDSIHADFALIARGDSMTGARIYNGDIVFIRKTPEVENGTIAAVRIGSEATLKRVRYQDGQIVLWAENNAYAPILVTTGMDVEIMGQAVCFYSEVR